MRSQTAIQQAEVFPPHIENAAACGRIVVVCEHASNTIPQRWGDMGLSAEQRLAHIAWDPGALGLARALAQRMDGLLVAAQVSRLIYDCNRPPHSAGAMAARSERHEILATARCRRQSGCSGSKRSISPFTTVCARRSCAGFAWSKPR